MRGSFSPRLDDPRVCLGFTAHRCGWKYKTPDPRRELHLTGILMSYNGCYGYNSQYEARDRVSKGSKKSFWRALGSDSETACRYYKKRPPRCYHDSILGSQSF